MTASIVMWRYVAPAEVRWRDLAQDGDSSLQKATEGDNMRQMAAAASRLYVQLHGMRCAADWDVHSRCSECVYVVVKIRCEQL